MMAEHLKPVLEFGVRCPQKWLTHRMGRMIALQKDDRSQRHCRWRRFSEGGRARTIAKQFSSRSEAATVPFQFALPTGAGCKCETHLIRGATDSISRNSMVFGFAEMVDGEQMILFLGARRMRRAR